MLALILESAEHAKTFALSSSVIVEVVFYALVLIISGTSTVFVFRTVVKAIDT